MSLKPIVALAASLAAIAQVDAHGGLMIPPCRNNRGNVNIFNFTKATGEKWLSGGSCAGDMCLWFNDGCFIVSRFCMCAAIAPPFVPATHGGSLCAVPAPAAEHDKLR
jgi:hypothetical protein